MSFAGRVPLIMACSFYLYEKSGKVQKLLHAIKYQEQKELANYLGNLYAKDLNETGVFNGVDLIMPVPLHENKLKERGFNQSEYFARGLSNGLKKDLDTSHLIRVVDTKTQTRRKKYERWENVEGIFEVQEPAALYGKHILLVDDVVTTGATIEAAWQALKKVEDVKVSVVSIAFADKNSS
jgi:ComF family protein